MYNLKSDHDVTVPVASLVSSPLIRSIMSGLHPALYFTPFVLHCPVDAAVLEIAGEIFTKGVAEVKDDQIHHEVQQLLEMLQVSAVLSCIAINPKPFNVGNAWMTKVKIENLELEIKLESLDHSDEDFNNQTQESSVPGILLESEAIDKMTFTNEEDEHLAQEDQDCRSTLNVQTENIPKSGVNQHEDTQREEREHKCSYCDYSTNESFMLKRHSRSHMKEKPYKCPNCDYASARHDNLLRHLRLYAEEKKYKCTECEYSACNSKHIKSHERIHDNKKCPHCEFSTNTNSHMKLHATVHTGEKPYSCPHCDYSTNHRSRLKRHVLRIHKQTKETVQN